MAFLFGEPKIHGDERRECLAYWAEELKLKQFQAVEADRYNNAVGKYGKSITTNSPAIEKWHQAANRSSKAMAELLRCHSELRVPDAASAMYFAWHTTYSDYLAWAEAMAAAVEALANDKIPYFPYVEGLFSQAGKSRRKAESEEKRFLKRLKLSADEVRELFISAPSATRAEDWQAEEVTEEDAEGIPQKVEEMYAQTATQMRDALFKVKRAFEGLDQRDTALMIAVNIGLIAPPARLSAALEALRRTLDELEYMLIREGISDIDDMLLAQRILLKQPWWGEFVDDWRKKWSIRNENDIGFCGYRYKKLQPYVYEFGYYYQTTADYKDKGA